METGFTFKGRHTREMGVSVATKSRTLLPAIRTITFEPSLGDGEIDLSSCNELGRPLFKNRSFTVTMLVRAEDITVLQNKLANVVSWLSGSGDLVFDDIPCVKWNVQYTEQIEYAPEIHGRKAVLSIVFHAASFSSALFEAGAAAPVLGDSIPLNARIPVGLSRMCTYTNNTSSTAYGEFTVYNIGTAYAKPVITVDFLFNSLTTGFTIRKGDKKIEIHTGASSGKYVIDMDKCRCTKDGEIICPSQFDVFELTPGENEISYAYITPGSTVTVAYTPKFLYSWEV